MVISAAKRPKLRAALRAAVSAVLSHLARTAGSPVITSEADYQTWTRHGQESIVALQRDIWLLPAEMLASDWLDHQFPEMTRLRAEAEADPVIGLRIDTPIGTEFSLRSLRFDRLLVDHVLRPTVLATRSYQFDEAAFAACYTRLESGLLADEIRMVQFLPLLGFSASVPRVGLTGGLLLRPMNDDEINSAIRHVAVPVESLAELIASAYRA